jgi:spoIIIJ-associated protein
MEWVETTGKSIEEAKGKALDQLGVAEDDAEFDILDEPRNGLFGFLRGEARVRARVRPTQPRPKLDRRDRKKRGAETPATAADDAAAGATDQASADAGGRPAKSPRRSSRARPAGDKPAAAADRPTAAERGTSRARGAHTDEASDTNSKSPARAGSNSTPKPRQASDDTHKETIVDAQQVGDEAQRFVQGLVDAFGVSGTTTVRRDGDDIEVVVEGTDLGLLVGPRGTTLQSVQELTRVASQRRLGDHDTRLRVDIAGYRELRRAALGKFAHQVATQVIADGTAKRLEPMSSADRKIIHDVLSEVDGVVTRSEGDDPQRCVVIEPANA